MELCEPQTMKQCEDLVKGLVDAHIHAGPSLMAREIDAWQMACEARQAGYSAIVVKDHHIPSVAAARIIQDHADVRGLKVFGSIVLNSSVGGLNPKAVEAAIGFGAAIVWMPTVSCENHALKHGGRGLKFPSLAQKQKVPERMVQLLDDRGNLAPEAITVLEVMAAYPEVALATGHGNRVEVDAVIRKAASLGIRRIIATHPSYMVDAAMEDLVAWTSLGAYIEVNAVTSVPSSNFYCIPPPTIAGIIRSLGPEKIIISSDYGQKGNGSPVAGLHAFLALLVNEGIEPAAIERMVRDNPSYLLNL
ncbi:MAG: hypothetical protein JW884_12650 [Deltaproteobacteria bacterium]|nr:hypothetical protein [Deltaproteobacteria bacterium]